MLHQINQQAPMRTERDALGLLHVHSWFETIQGEGPFAGEAAFFIRLVGCNLQCPGCDTEYTSNSVELHPLTIAALCSDHSTVGGLVVITGGEPFRQNITPTAELLLDHGFRVQVESNGVLFDEAFPHDRATVVISPKTGKIHPRAAETAAAFKYVLAHDNVAEDGLPVQALGHPLGNYPHVARPPRNWTGPIYLQPMDVKDEEENRRNAQAVVKSVMTHRRYIMGVQMHKMTGLP